MNNINCLLAVFSFFFHKKSIIKENVFIEKKGIDEQNLNELIVENVLLGLTEKKKNFKNSVKIYKEIMHDINFINPSLFPNFDSIEFDPYLYVGFNGFFHLENGSNNENKIYFNLSDKNVYKKAKKGELVDDLIKIGIKFYDDSIVSMNNILMIKTNKL